MDGDLMVGEADTLILETVRRFVAREVTPHVRALEESPERPAALIARMKDLGLFGMAVPEEHGGLGLPLEQVAEVIEEIARGWTTLAGYLNSHSTVCYVLAKHGTPGQKSRYLPRLAAGDLCAALTLTEADAGSDLQAIRTRAVRHGASYVLNGAKIYVTNGRSAGLLLALVKTDPKAEPAHHGLSLFLVENGAPGVEVGGDFHKMAYDHVDTCEIRYVDAPLTAEQLLGDAEGKGLQQLLDGLEVGRILIAASATGLAWAALQEAINFAKQRVTFGKPIAQHQAIQLTLADMATRIEAGRLLTREASRQKQAGRRADLATGMAKLFCSAACLDAVGGALRIHGGAGYIKGTTVERYFREAPLYIVGEGTNEIQKLVIARRLLEEGTP
jgi:alkylation response protein AidB-like acyl-CoA dehydrogenase